MMMDSIDHYMRERAIRQFCAYFVCIVYAKREPLNSILSSLSSKCVTSIYKLQRFFIIDLLICMENMICVYRIQNNLQHIMHFHFLYYSLYLVGVKSEDSLADTIATFVFFFRVTVKDAEVKIILCFNVVRSSGVFFIYSTTDRMQEYSI